MATTWDDHWRFSVGKLFEFGTLSALLCEQIIPEIIRETSLNHGEMSGHFHWDGRSTSLQKGTLHHHGHGMTWINRWGNMGYLDCSSSPTSPQRHPVAGCRGQIGWGWFSALGQEPSCFGTVFLWTRMGKAKHLRSQMVPNGPKVQSHLKSLLGIAQFVPCVLCRCNSWHANLHADQLSKCVYQWDCFWQPVP